MAITTEESRQTRWRENNREKYLEQRRASYQRNRENRLAYAAAYRAANPEKVREVNRRWYRNDPEHARALARSYAARDRDKINERKRAAYAADPEKARARTRRFRKENPEKVKQSWNEWRVTPRGRELMAANAARQYANRSAAPIIDVVVRSVVLERDAGLCGICGDAVDAKDFHLDHIVPLSRGGEHSYANTQLAHPICNMRKGAR